MKFAFHNDDVTKLSTGLVGLMCFEDGMAEGAIFQSVDKALEGLLSRLVAEEQFKGKKGQTLLLHTHGRVGPSRLLLVGAGRAKRLFAAGSARLRRAGLQVGVGGLGQERHRGDALHRGGGAGAGGAVPRRGRALRRLQVRQVPHGRQEEDRHRRGIQDRRLHRQRRQPRGSSRSSAACSGASRWRRRWRWRATSSTSPPAR